MFNPLTPAEVVAAIGVTARDAARSEDPAGEFERDQLLSAYSATRHLAAELVGSAPLLERFRTDLAERLRLAQSGDGAVDAVAGRTAATVEADRSAAAIGEAVSQLLVELRASPSEPATRLRAEIHVLLRELADREVDLLADALG